MENCLVRKLEGSVNNNELLRVGEYLIYGKEVQLNTIDENPVVARIIKGNGVFPNGEKTYTVPGNYTYVPITTNETCVIAINDGYRTSRILASENVHIDLAQLKYRKSLYYVYRWDPNYVLRDIITGDLSNMAEQEWNSVDFFAQRGITGDIKNIKIKLRGSQNEGYIYLNETGATGNIKSLGQEDVKNIVINGTPTISGTVEELVANLRMTRPTGTIKFNMDSSCGVTIGGQHVDGDLVNILQGPDLTWTANQFTWNGITIDA